MVHCKSFGYEGDYKVLEYTGGPRNCYDCIDKYGAYYRFYESDLEPYTEPKQPVSDCHHLQEPKSAEPSETLCMDSEGFYRKGTDEHCNKVKVRIPSGETEPYTEPKEDHSVVNNEMVKDFDTILKDSFSKERRLNIAAIAMRGILNNPDEVYRAEICSTAKETPQAIAEYALALADALLAECEKGGSHEKA